MKAFTNQNRRFKSGKYHFVMVRLLKAFSMFFLIIVLFQISGCSTNKENSSAEAIRQETLESEQNLYVIEREIPGAGNLTADELKEISNVSNGVITELGPEIKWLHSYVTGDKIYCVYTAPNEELIKEHALKGGFPSNAVSKVGTVIDPSTGK